jgi:hypothetical protein
MRVAWVLAGTAWTAVAMLAPGCADRRKHAPPVPVTAESAGSIEPLPASPPCPIQLHEVTPETGITFLHTDGSCGRHYIVEAMSTGLATFDYDGDGLVDIYFPNGAPLPGLQVDQPPRHALYRNLGNWKFQEVTDAAGVVCHAYGLGITIGDYDSDGHPDIYLNHFGHNVLYRNNGDGTFSDVTESAGVGRGMLVGAGACFLDMDGDGDLDLYVGNYIRLDLSRHVTRTQNGVPRYPSPTEYVPVPDTLYCNNGDGTFTDISRESGIAAHAGRSMGMICADYDNDGDTDVFICNDVQENFLFRNDGHGKFEEVASLVGVAYDAEGEIRANMAVDAGDFDRDGWLDFYTTNYQNQLPMLFRNLRSGFLEDVARSTNAGAGAYAHVNWGCSFVDFDNDGYLDLYVANGHTEDTVEQLGMGGAYRARNVVLRNRGQGSFADVSSQCGDGLLPEFVSRGIALDDLDNDGDVDVVVLHSRDRPSVLRNMLYEQGGSHHWLQVQLRGVRTNRDGVGARVEVQTDDLRLVDEVHSGRGYQSHWGSLLNFGLGGRKHVQQITVRWIGGQVEMFSGFAVDRRITLVEGRGQARSLSWSKAPGPCSASDLLP